MDVDGWIDGWIDGWMDGWIWTRPGAPKNVNNSQWPSNAGLKSPVFRRGVVLKKEVRGRLKQDLDKDF